jgi:acetolactate synthase-1/2/3 large subunit
VRQLDTTDWQLKIAGWKREHPLRYQSGPQIRAQHVFRVLGEVTGGEAVVVTDVGQHQMWAAQFFPCMHPRTFITSGGLGTMGFSLPAAMGVAFARLNLPIISISGDGGFQMNSQELTTIVQHKLPVKIFVINNGFLGMVRQWQDLFWKRRYSQVEMTSPDFVKLAEAHGCPGFRATTSSEVEDLVRRAMGYTDGPVLVEFVVAQEDNVYPMIPAGQTVAEMLDTPLDPEEEGVTIYSPGDNPAAYARKEEHRGVHTS